ncbi:KUP/HAK/KT family potassium transporter [Bifidobacterium myosotis]|uniref:Potassium transporter Kup n=1 Tax=Bifidobacterium myosotis TaxID=1630166 RepID=A0A5M9ZHF2_9BIFI|nr:KUP/HAK/KT family potassium transporter [Bifidobacterium myosotis]KAA8826990.1 potassium transporter Kup [Bifidobacterium myosotis]
MAESHARPAAGPRGMLVAVGIVYGDLATSPVYAPKALMIAQGGAMDRERILDSLSLVFWSMLLVVTLKYVVVAMNADNDGGGGVFALFSSVRAAWRPAAVFAMVGAAAFLADSVFTPAVSVSSAVEGLASIPAVGGSPAWTPRLSVLLTVGIVTLLFAVQHAGSHRLGGLFGPVMTIWLAAMGGVGAVNLARDPTVLAALDPTVGIRFLLSDANKAGVGLMGSVFLALTGAEALYSDMGHVGRANIRLTWPAVCLMLQLSYFGQGAWMLAGHRIGAADAAPFFLSAPAPARPFLVALALAAGVIASQALISGAFTLTAAADGLGWLPRLDMRYPGVSRGQIYIPAVCAALGALTVAVVLYFRSSGAMEAAYGLALIVAMLMDTILLAARLARVRRHPVLAAAVCGPFAAMDLLFLAAAAGKFVEGGYVTALVWTAVFALFRVCSRGSRLERAQRGRLRADELARILAAAKADERRDAVADNLICLTADTSMRDVEKDVAAAMIRHRAGVYWLLTLVQSARPYGREWRHAGYGCLHRVVVTLGYREPQFHLRRYMRAIMADLLASGELVRIEPRWPRLASRSERLGAGTVRYMLLHRVVGPESAIPDSDRTLLRLHRWIKRHAGRPVEWFGLESDDPIIETVPVWTGAERDVPMTRIRTDAGHGDVARG